MKDPIAEFYDRHPYPPAPDAVGRDATSDLRRRAAHHLVWPERPPESVASILVAGCGTVQAVRHAQAHPDARVVGIDVSETSLDHARRLATQAGLTNVDLELLPIESVDELGETFDHVICTGVLHHLADPALGLRRLRAVMAPGAALTVMVYARHGRAGVYMFQEYCRRLGVGSDSGELSELVATLREIPLGHPLSRLLRESRDFADDDALADALCNPRDVAYTAPEVIELLDSAGLRFGRWAHQAPYLPDCGSISETPHATRIAALEAVDQYGLVELFRGTIVRHTAVAFRDDDHESGFVDFTSPRVGEWVPIPSPTAVSVSERLPRGASAALLNSAHTETDLVLFVDADGDRTFRSIDGATPLSCLGPRAVRHVERMWRHDLVVIDSSRAEADPR